jgi:hypothetical protein
MTDGLPHIYRIACELLPPGLVTCVCCEELRGHGEIEGFDEDLVGYVCEECLAPLAQAECRLIMPWIWGGRIRARRPEMMETLGLDDVEARALETGTTNGHEGGTNQGR